MKKHGFLRAYLGSPKGRDSLRKVASGKFLDKAGSTLVCDLELELVRIPNIQMKKHGFLRAYFGSLKVFCFLSSTI